MYYLRCFLPWRTNTNMDRLVFPDTLTSRPSVPSSHLRICWTDWRTWCVTSWTVCSNLLPLSCSTTSTRFVAALGAKWRSHRLICEYLLKFGFFYSQDFKPPKRPFRRMNYSEAIVWLKEHDIKKDDGTYYEFGEVGPEYDNRFLTN